MRPERLEQVQGYANGSHCPSHIDDQRVYRGCTVFGCEWGFDGEEREMPSEWSHCPKCGSDLEVITVRRLPS